MCTETVRVVVSVSQPELLFVHGDRPLRDRLFPSEQLPLLGTELELSETEDAPLRSCAGRFSLLRTTVTTAVLRAVSMRMGGPGTRRGQGA